MRCLFFNFNNGKKMTYYFTTVPISELKPKDTVILDCAHPDLYDVTRHATKINCELHRYYNPEVLYIHPKRENI